MSDLRETLDQVLRTVDPGPAPVDAVVRRGKRIRLRRRAATFASVAAVVAFAVAGYPALTRHQAGPGPGPATHRPTVTDIPPGPGAPAGLIASGEISGTPWQVIATPPTGGVERVCLLASSRALGPDIGNIGDCGPSPAPDAATPVTFQVFAGDTRASINIGQVRADVQYVAVAFGDGTRLKLIPVTYRGVRYVAFPSPGTTPVLSATAYLANGQYRTAIPFNAPSGQPVFATWLAPGQKTLPAASRLIASAVTGGQRWSLTAYVGAWGTCLVERNTTGAYACLDDGASGNGTAPRGAATILGTFANPPQVFYGSAVATASYIQVSLDDGSNLRVTPVQVGGEHLFAFSCGGASVTNWTAYDAAGHKLT